jgi:hypothetical protein
MGRPDPERICSSIVTRQKLTLRMQNRSLTRLANTSPKKWEILWSALCLHFACSNPCRNHRRLRVAPTMEEGITDHVC